MTPEEQHIGTPLPVDPRFGTVDCLFFVIGAQKSGTTWLQNYCSVHPEITMCSWKETNYWNCVAGDTNARKYLQSRLRRRRSRSAFYNAKKLLTFNRDKILRRQGMDLVQKAHDNPNAPHTEYAKAIFQNRTPQSKAAGDISPFYALLEAETFQQMNRLAQNVKFVFIIRDPVSRFISGVLHRLKRTSGKEAITPQLLSASIHKSLGQTGGAPLDIAFSQYDRTVQSLEKVAKPEQIQLLYFEELFEQRTLNAFCEFVCVSERAGDFQTVVNSGTGMNSQVAYADRLAIARALSPVYEFAIRRFGSDLPEEWLQSAALANVPVPDWTEHNLRDDGYGGPTV